MMFIKACRYYGLMKNDKAVDDEAGGRPGTAGLHRNAKVIANNLKDLS